MKNNQKGFVPVIAIIITFLIIGGAAVVVQREVKKGQQNKSNNSQTAKSSSVKETKGQGKNDAKTSPKSELSKNSFVSEPKQAGLAEPGFSITPPSDWVEVKASSEDTLVIFESPDGDKMLEEVVNSKVENVWLSIKARTSVLIAKSNAKSLDMAVSNVREGATKQGVSVIKLEKTKLNGEDAYYYEGIQKMEGTKADGTIRAELESELLKLGKGVSRKDVQSREVESKIDKIMSNFVMKIEGYLLYKDGYAITVAGKSLNSFWGKRGPQISSSLKTFKILSALDKAVSEEEALKGFSEYSKAKSGNFVSNAVASLPKFNLSIPSGWMQKTMQGNSYYKLELRPANKYLESWISVTTTKSVGGTVDDLPKQPESKRDEKITKSGQTGRVIEYTQNKYSDTPQRVLTYSFIVDAYLMEISAVVPERDWEKLSDQIKNVFDSFEIKQ